MPGEGETGLPLGQIGEDLSPVQALTGVIVPDQSERNASFYVYVQAQD